MGFLEKMKNVFVDEEEIVEEEKFVETKEEDIISERDFFKQEEPIEEEIKKGPVVEEKKKPIIFEEKDLIFESKPIKKVEPKKEEVKKPKFKPSPVISPVYGLLEEEKGKEDPRVVKEFVNDPRDLNVDSVRKKAYGTLEDILEDTLSMDNSVLFYNLKDKEKKEVSEETEKLSLDELVEEKPEEIKEEKKEEELDVFDMLDSIYEEDE